MYKILLTIKLVVFFSIAYGQTIGYVFTNPKLKEFDKTLIYHLKQFDLDIIDIDNDIFNQELISNHKYPTKIDYTEEQLLLFENKNIDYLLFIDVFDEDIKKYDKHYETLLEAAITNTLYTSKAGYYNFIRLNTVLVEVENKVRETQELKIDRSKDDPSIDIRIWAMSLNSDLISLNNKFKNWRKDDNDFENAISKEVESTYEKLSIVVRKPRIMVIPSGTLSLSKFKNGVYSMSKEQRYLIGAMKSELENQLKINTIGFESSIRKYKETAEFEHNSKTSSDDRSTILSSSGADYYIEFIEINRSTDNCIIDIDFKVRNYATSEDIASKIKSFSYNCNTNKPKWYTEFVKSILNEGVDKIVSQHEKNQINGSKVFVDFIIDSDSKVDLFSVTNSKTIEEHIEDSIKMFSYNSNYILGGVVKYKMEFPQVNIPILDSNKSKNSSSSFARNIKAYLREKANVKCGFTVIGSNIHFELY